MVVTDMTREQQKRDSHFKTVRRIAQMGNSLGIGIPKEIVEKFNINRGDEFEFRINEETGEIIIKPVTYLDLPEGVRPDVMKAMGKAFTKYNEAFQNLKHR